MTHQAPAGMHLNNGTWTEGADPIGAVWQGAAEGTAESDLLRSLGYRQMFSLGSRFSQAGFETWRRLEQPRYLIVVDDEEHTEYLYVHTLPDLLDTCARWSSLVRDIAITEFLTETVRDEAYAEKWADPRQGFIETIARRAAGGAQQPYRHPNQ